MTISARIIKDSIGLDSPRLTTFELKYPRFIHSELMTHRVFSRNASSSRAIPVERMIDDILRDPAMPVHWGRNQRGMQADGEHDALVVVPSKMQHGFDALVVREEAWLDARDYAVSVARAFNEAGYHKQVVNRLLEPFMHISVIVTATQFSNWFHLRQHEDAMPDIQVLANAMFEAYSKSTPEFLSPGQWHMPYVTPEDIEEVNNLALVLQHPSTFISDPVVYALLRISTARCARVSYLNHDGTRPDINKDFELYVRLVGGECIHASPPEHQATPDVQKRMQTVEDDGFVRKSGMEWCNTSLSGNFDPGWIQHRKLIVGECR